MYSDVLPKFFARFPDAPVETVDFNIVLRDAVAATDVCYVWLAALVEPLLSEYKEVAQFTKHNICLSNIFIF